MLYFLTFFFTCIQSIFQKNSYPSTSKKSSSIFFFSSSFNSFIQSTKIVCFSNFLAILIVRMWRKKPNAFAGSHNFKSLILVYFFLYWQICAEIIKSFTKSTDFWRCCVVFFLLLNIRFFNEKREVKIVFLKFRATAHG